MEEPTQVNLRNRTGIKMSPKHSKELLDSVEGRADVPAPRAGDGAGVTELRLDYMAHTGPIGSIPPPASVSGAARTAVKWATGKRPEIFIDKLAERCAFERSGVRLYEGLLAKFDAEQQNGGDIGPVTRAKLQEIRGQEESHFHMLAECIEKLGGDPTAQTPSADLVGVESLGLVQAMSDPRTSLLEALHTALAAELIDVANWELLAEMAGGIGQPEMETRFHEALRQEEDHLATIRSWYSTLLMTASGSA